MPVRLRIWIAIWVWAAWARGIARATGNRFDVRLPDRVAPEINTPEDLAEAVLCAPRKIKRMTRQLADLASIGSNCIALDRLKAFSPRKRWSTFYAIAQCMTPTAHICASQKIPIPMAKPLL